MQNTIAPPSGMRKLCIYFSKSPDCCIIRLCSIMKTKTPKMHRNAATMSMIMLNQPKTSANNSRLMHPRKELTRHIFWMLFVG